MNQKKFNEPVTFSLRLEKEDRKEINKRCKCVNDWINAAIKEKLKREAK